MPTKSTYIALAAGAAVGAVTALLFAPASGKETRSKLAKQGKKLRKDLNEMVEKGRAAVDSAKEVAKEAAKNGASPINKVA